MRQGAIMSQSIPYGGSPGGQRLPRVKPTEKAEAALTEINVVLN